MNDTRTYLQLAWTLLSLVVSLWIAPTSRVEAWDETFLTGLRQRRLFALAERHCELRWSDPSLNATARGALAVEWIMTLTEHARHAKGEQRQQLVDEAHQVARKFLDAHSDHSLAFLVRTQDALSDAMLGELTRLESEVAADPMPRIDEARRLCRGAARALEQVDRQLTEFLPQRFRRPAPGDELSAEQLASLQHQVRLQAARAHRNLALAYDASSDDRLASLARGIQYLEASLRQLTPEMPLHAPFCLELAAQQRLLEKPDAARETLGRLTMSSLAPALQLALRSEAARLALATGRLAEAERLVADDVRRSGGVEAEWDFCRLEVLLALWQAAAGRAEDVAARERQALTLLDEIERDHGPFWKLRGDLLLVKLGGAAGTRNAELVSRAADSLVAQGRPDEALAAYDEALVQARQSGNTSAAFSLGYKSGLLQQQRGRHGDAAARLRDAAIGLPAEPRAAAAHLAAAWNLAQQLRSDPSLADARVGESYIEWLEEHARRWPQSSTADQSRVWLGNWFESRRRWSDAATVLRGVSDDSAFQLVAWRGVLRNSTLALDESARNVPRDLTRLATQAEELLRWLDNHKLPDEPTPEDRHATVVLRTYCLLLIPNREGEARELLRVDESWPVDRAFALATWIAAWYGDVPADRRAALASLLLEAVTRARTAESALPEADRQTLDRLWAESLARSGRRTEAIDALRKLAADRPRDGDVRRTLAELLEAGTTTADHQSALDAWRRIASQSPPRSELWFRAKLGVATALVRMGERQEADKLIRFLQATPPGLSNTPWEEPFARLLEESRKP